jgi:predicted phage tail protein
MLRTVVLHGALAEEFGARFTLDVISPIEAVRALMGQIRGFRRRIRDGHYRILKKREEREVALGLDELEIRLGTAPEVHIVPVIHGAISSGMKKIIIGVAIVALAVAAPYALGIAGGLGASAIGGATVFGATVTFGQIASIGLGLALSGVAQMLSPTPQMAGGSAQQDRRESFLFGGQENTGAQGGPVPLVFGEFVVGSTVVSAGLAAERI